MAEICHMYCNCTYTTICGNQTVEDAHWVGLRS
jgi:hypothetical protein